MKRCQKDPWCGKIDFVFFRISLSTTTIIKRWFFTQYWGNKVCTDTFFKKAQKYYHNISLWFYLRELVGKNLKGILLFSHVLHNTIWNWFLRSLLMKRFSKAIFFVTSFSHSKLREKLGLKPLQVGPSSGKALLILNIFIYCLLFHLPFIIVLKINPE